MYIHTRFQKRCFFKNICHYSWLASPSLYVMFWHLPDSGRHVTSVFQGLFLCLSLQGTGRRGPWEQGWHQLSKSFTVLIPPLSVRLIKANFPYSIQHCWDTTTDKGIWFCSMKVYRFGRLLEERLCELHKRISFSRISKFIHERSSGMASARNPKPEVLISPTWLGLAHHWTILSKFRTQAPPINGQTDWH